MRCDPVEPDLIEEAKRITALRRYEVLDTPPDGAFERITSLAARLLRVPIALVSLVDSDRIWFKSRHGLEVDEIGRDPGLCSSAICQYEPWVINNARLDERALANPLVAGEIGLQFYAGIPLTTHDGFNIGTLCVIDKEPRHMSEEQLDNLKDLAAIVMDEMELRLAARRTVSLETQLREQAQNTAEILQQGLLPRSLPEVKGLDIASRYHVANREIVGGDFYDVIVTDDGCTAMVGDACGKGTLAASLTSVARWILWDATLDGSAPNEALGRLNRVLLRVHHEAEQYCTIALASFETRPSGGAVVSVALAGHPWPIIVKLSGQTSSLGIAAPAAGWIEDSPFHISVAELDSGDFMLLYTDGLLEALAGHGSAEDGAIRELLSGAAGCTADEIADRIDAALGNESLRDDAAFLVIRPSSK